MCGKLKWLTLMSFSAPSICLQMVSAQTVQPDHLVGTWRTVEFAQTDRRHHKPLTVRETLLTLNADRTWQLQVKQDGVEMTGRLLPDAWGTSRPKEGRWYVLGSLFWFEDPAKMGDYFASAEAKKILFQGGKLVLGAPERFRCDARVFEPVDPSTPTPPAVLPPSAPATVRSTDLVGTWVTTYMEVHYEKIDDTLRRSDTLVVRTDTLTLHADSTWTVVRTGALGQVLNPRGHGEWWAVLPGDTLWLTNSEAPRVKLQGRQLSLTYDCGNSAAKPLVVTYWRAEP